MSTAPLTLIEWKAKEGDLVEQGSVILVIETEKIRHDVEAEISGFMHILVEEGQEVPIGTVAGLIAETKEELEALQKEKPSAVSTPAEIQEASSVEVATPFVAKAKEREHIKISPVARKMAEEHMVDISKVVGSGPGGRIVREDIEKAIEAKKVAVTPVVSLGKRVKSTIPLKGMRKAIAEHMHRSLAISAQVTIMGEIDMTEMIKLRETLVGQAESIGIRITYTDIFVLATAKALKDHPIINSSLLDNEIKLWEDINIGVAVALDEGLIVPVIKGTDKKSLVEISQARAALVEKARAGKLVPDEVTGGTFTISNLGALETGGYRFETVIINQPESVILGTGRVTDRVVARDGQIVIRPIMTYYLTYDHRVIVGAVAAEFIATLIKLLETP
ncbi:MAG: 2-oxo acid dehydrogenase subunit E2, partial [Dehalococcoidales bacterium]|nr:2-oxo acid dehydrogenase subunit E2 [Dehalococcoidales bacterium]